MNVPSLKNKNGFTIIEVVLVLAIAALIFLMVFIALPALQRNQRDTQRKNDVGRTLTAVNNYQSNNRGKLPTAWDTFATDYLKSDADGGEFNDPSEGQYTFTVQTTPALKPTKDDIGEIFVKAGAVCAEDGDIDTNAGSRKVAFRMYLEGGGVYCQSN